MGLSSMGIDDQTPASQESGFSSQSGADDGRLSIDTRVFAPKSDVRTVKSVLAHPEGLHQMPANNSRIIFNHYFKGEKPPNCFMHIYVNPWFERLTLGVIVVNALWIGFDVDFNHDGSDVPKLVFEVGESIFCTLFTFELFVRYMSYPTTKTFFTDPDMNTWNFFDLFLVALMITDTWVLTYILKVEASNMKALSSLRLLRLLRLSKVFRLVPELGMMVTSLVAAIRSVFSTCILALLIMYIFAILFCQWTKSYGSKPPCLEPDDYDICLQTYFGTIWGTFLTLMQILTFDDTFEVVRPILNENFLMGILLIVYMLLVCFTVLNMLIGIICDVVAEVSKGEEEKLLKMKMEDLFKHLDADHSGFVSRDEFEASGAMEHLGFLGVSENLSKTAFDMLDVDGDGEISCSEFVTMIFKCLHPPDAEDIMRLEIGVDRLADLTGIGRQEVAILQKDREKYEADAEMLAEMAKVLPSSLSSTTLGEIMKQDSQPVLERFEDLFRRLEDLNLLIEAGPLTGDTSANAMKEYDEAVLDALPSTPEMEDLAKVMRPTIRVLIARLHALRAECKVMDMQFAGDLTSSLGQKRGRYVSLLYLRPLDDLISEVIQRLTFTCDRLLPPEPISLPMDFPPTSPAGSRKSRQSRVSRRSFASSRRSTRQSKSQSRWSGVKNVLEALGGIGGAPGQRQSVTPGTGVDETKADDENSEGLLSSMTPGSLYDLEDEAEAPALKTLPAQDVEEGHGTLAIQDASPGWNTSTAAVRERNGYPSSLNAPVAMVCGKCGQPQEPDSLFCEKCGAKLS